MWSLSHLGHTKPSVFKRNSVLFLVFLSSTERKDQLFLISGTRDTVKTVMFRIWNERPDSLRRKQRKTLFQTINTSNKPRSRSEASTVQKTQQV